MDKIRVLLRLMLLRGLVDEEWKSEVDDGKDGQSGW
jgi:hypothetical protein